MLKDPELTKHIHLKSLSNLLGCEIFQLASRDNP